MRIEMRDDFWAPRRRQLREHTLPVMLERLEAQGVVENFRRLAGASDADRAAMHFSDSDLYKWIEAAVLADRLDLAEPMIDLVDAVKAEDGYVHTYYGVDGRARYTDLDFGHEHYCAGHLIEAAIAHHEVTGSDRFLGVAVRLADHLVGTFGPGRDERTDAHPEIELALARLAAVTGDRRYLDHARWVIEARLATVGTTVATFELGGHAVRSLYLASGIAEVALATGDDTYVATTRRILDDLLALHSYPTGGVGGRWLGESVGRPYELPDATAYAESCAAVAAVQFCERVWRLTEEPRALDQIELLLFNAVPCGVGADGASWFYSQPQAVDAVTAEINPWAQPFDYADITLGSWFPARRHRWFLVPCCPPNLARLFATVDRYVADRGADGTVRVHLPIAATITDEDWSIEVDGGYPDDGAIAVRTHGAAPAVAVRVPGWAGGDGHVAVDGAIDLPVDWTWWETDPRVSGAEGTVFLRRGPVVHCVEGRALDGADLRDLVVDPTLGPDTAFAVAPADGPLHRPVGAGGSRRAIAVTTTPYAEWANGPEPTTMRIRFRRA